MVEGVGGFAGALPASPQKGSFPPQRGGKRAAGTAVPAAAIERPALLLSLPALQKGSFPAVAGRELSGVSLTEGRGLLLSLPALPKRLLPPSGEEAVRRSLTDGRGYVAIMTSNCLASYLAGPLRGTGWGLRAPTPCGSSFEKEEPENGDTLPLVKSLLYAVFRGGGHNAQCVIVSWLHPCSLGTQPVPFTRPEKQLRDLTSSATVAVRGAPWLCSASLASRTKRFPLVAILPFLPVFQQRKLPPQKGSFPAAAGRELSPSGD